MTPEKLKARREARRADKREIEYGANGVRKGYCVVDSDAYKRKMKVDAEIYNKLSEVSKPASIYEKYGAEIAIVALFGLSLYAAFN